MVLTVCLLASPFSARSLDVGFDSFSGFFDAFDDLMKQQREMLQKTFDKVHQDWNDQMGRFQKEQMRLKVDDQDAAVVLTVDDIQLSEDGKELPVNADIVYGNKQETKELKIHAGQSKLKIRYQDGLLDASVVMQVVQTEDQVNDAKNEADAKKVHKSHAMQFSTRKAMSVLGELDLEKVQIEADYKNNRIMVTLPKTEVSKNHKKVLVKTTR